MPFLSRNVRFKRSLKSSLWRSISISSWRVTHDSSIIAILDLDAEPALAFIAEEQKKTKVRLTMTHYAGWCLAQVYQRHPEMNCMVRWGRLYQRQQADLSFLVAAGDPRSGDEDLSGVVVREMETKSITEIGEDLQNQVIAIRNGNDVTFSGIKHALGVLPHLIRRPLVNLADFIMHSLNIWTPLLGIKKDAFGSAMVTSVGSLGIEFAIARIYPQSRNSMIMSVGAVKEQPVVKNGQVVVGKKLKVVFTVDHRVVDGVHGGYMLQTFSQLFERK